jgi:hypothetical protein
VEEDEREAAPDLLDEHPVAVRQPNLHPGSLRVPVDPDERVQLIVVRVEELADPAEARLREGADRVRVADASGSAMQAVVFTAAKTTSRTKARSTSGPSPLPISSSSPTKRSTPATPAPRPTSAAKSGWSARR